MWADLLSCWGTTAQHHTVENAAHRPMDQALAVTLRVREGRVLVADQHTAKRKAGDPVTGDQFAQSNYKLR